MHTEGNNQTDRSQLTDEQKKQIEAVLISFTQKIITTPEMCRQIEQITQQQVQR